MQSLFLRSLAAGLIAIWLLLVFLGKGGFVHLLLFNGLAVALIEAVCMYRKQVRE